MKVIFPISKGFLKSFKGLEMHVNFFSSMYRKIEERIMIQEFR